MQHHLQAHLQSQNAAAGPQQVITLQQLQNFLPSQQIQTIDGHQVQVISSAANETTPTKQIKQERFVLTPQMQSQPQVIHLQNLQPQQFIQVKDD